MLRLGQELLQKYNIVSNPNEPPKSARRKLQKLIKLRNENTLYKNHYMTIFINKWIKIITLINRTAYLEQKIDL